MMDFIQSLLILILGGLQFWSNRKVKEYSNATHKFVMSLYNEFQKLKNDSNGNN